LGEESVGLLNVGESEGRRERQWQAGGGDEEVALDPAVAGSREYRQASNAGVGDHEIAAPADHDVRQPLGAEH